MFRTSSAVSGGSRKYSAKSYDVSFRPCLNGQWAVTYRCGSASETEYGLASELIGRLFVGGIHTVAELEVAELLAGLRPAAIGKCNATGVRYLKAEPFAKLLNGTHPVSKLDNAADAAKLQQLWDEASQLGPKERTTKEWWAAAANISITALPYGCELPESMLDRDMIEWDIQRSELVKS